MLFFLEGCHVVFKNWFYMCFESQSEIIISLSYFFYFYGNKGDVEIVKICKIQVIENIF